MIDQRAPGAVKDCWVMIDQRAPGAVNDCWVMIDQRAPGAVVFVRIGPIRFLAGCRKRRLNQG